MDAPTSSRWMLILTHIQQTLTTQAGSLGQNKGFNTTEKGGDLMKFIRLLYSTGSYLFCAHRPETFHLSSMTAS